MCFLVVLVYTSTSHNVCDGAGSQFTGTAINPARALGPAIVFHCHWNVIWLYVIAGTFAAAVPVAIQTSFVNTVCMISLLGAQHALCATYSSGRSCCCQTCFTRFASTQCIEVLIKVHWVLRPPSSPPSLSCPKILVT